MVYFGGRFGNRQAFGESIVSVISDEETLFRVTDAAVDYFSAHANTSERLRVMIDRTGWDGFKTAVRKAYDG
jgi:dissimilatory sulfite reductase (desulfoviridin) alpha/beta subunit